ncbi:HTH-type transcriptional regulator CymR [subsurface metagenome]
MKVSSRFRYGLRLLVDLAIKYQKNPVLLKDIAECEKISKKYLEQIVITLRTSGLIGATRGSKGGYYLTKPPNKIKIAEIYKILEGSFAPVDCLDNPNICTLVKNCPTRKIWSDLAKSIKKTFGNQTLADLTKKME